MNAICYTCDCHQPPCECDCHFAELDRKQQRIADLEAALRNIMDLLNGSHASPYPGCAREVARKALGLKEE